MTKFEMLMKKSDECETKAINEKDLDLRMFWHNASAGFKEKALSLPVMEGVREVE